MNFNAIVTVLTAMVLVPFGNALAVEAKVYAAFPSPTIEAIKAMDDENPPIPTVRVVPPTNNQQSPALTQITQVDKAGGYGPYVTWDIPRIG
ncbi:uncharacterized protein KQ657_003037 [Scheffersomyces spartinae]|uniref:Uncharacterized protein n=1 Tax=Scheffersomyces spartinae TaxID=45513 RepID=A0A9P7V5E8_9ASCO|nr:uncharacterized protein KQ657_003037 [Scheffersomyces spartinae]KAG7191533.1 hypothetical protein KQ657_003037 [Scheffersomyces spartinae]